MPPCGKLHFLPITETYIHSPGSIFIYMTWGSHTQGYISRNRLKRHSFTVIIHFWSLRIHINLATPKFHYNFNSVILTKYIYIHMEAVLGHKACKNIVYISDPNITGVCKDVMHDNARITSPLYIQQLVHILRAYRSVRRTKGCVWDLCIICCMLWWL